MAMVGNFIKFCTLCDRLQNLTLCGTGRLSDCKHKIQDARYKIQEYRNTKIQK